MNQEEIKKKQKRVMIYVLIISLICVVGVSYAFFTAGMSSETSTTVRADAGTMKITYNGGKDINLAGIYPKDDVWATKTITVTGNNTTDAEMYYKLTLVVDSNTFKCSLHKNAGSGKAAGYVIAPSRVSFSVLPVAALSGAVRYLRRSAPAAAVSLPPGAACAAETVRHTLFLTVHIPVSMLSGQ